MTTDPPVSTAAVLEALRRRSNLALAEFSQGQQDAANTLLEKAAAALDDGDPDRARVLVQQAKALGRDEHEGVEVCSLTAHMALFTLVSDVAEEAAPLVWLQAAEAVLPTLTRNARGELLESLMITGSETIEPEPAEARLLARLVRGAEQLTSVWDGRILEVDDVLEVLAAINAYDDAVAEIEDES